MQIAANTSVAATSIAAVTATSGIAIRSRTGFARTVVNAQPLVERRCAGLRRSELREVGDGRLELGVGACLERGAHPLLELVVPDPALGVSLVQALDELLAIVVGCPQIASPVHTREASARPRRPQMSCGRPAGHAAATCDFGTAAETARRLACTALAHAISDRHPGAATMSPAT